MSRPLPFQLGAAAEPLFWVIAAALLALILVAVLLEYRRRGRARRTQVRAERKLIDEIAREKKFKEEEKEALLQLVDKYFAQTPLAVVKDRAVFDKGVQEEIQAAEAAHDERRLRKSGLVLRSVREKLDFQYVPMGQRIWSTRELYEGQIVWLGKEEEPVRWYEGAVSAVDEAFLHVTLIDARAGGGAVFEAGKKVRCRLWREDDARYIFTAFLRGCTGQPATCTLRHSTDVNRMQAREYYRVHYAQDAQLNLLKSETPETGPPEEVRIVAQWPAHFTSLSAGGFAVVGRKPLPAGVRVKIEIDLPGEEAFEAEACTVGGEVLPGDRHLIRAKFTDIGEEKRDLIAHYVSMRQQPNLAHSLEQAQEQQE